MLGREMPDKIFCFNISHFKTPYSERFFSRGTLLWQNWVRSPKDDIDAAFQILFEGKKNLRNISLLISLRNINKPLQKVNSISKAAHGGSTISCPVWQIDVPFTGTFSGRDIPVAQW